MTPAKPDVNSRLARIVAQRPVRAAVDQVADAVIGAPVALPEVAHRAADVATVTSEDEAAPVEPIEPTHELPRPLGGAVVSLAIQLPEPVSSKDRTRPCNVTWHGTFIKRFDRYCKKMGVSRSSMSELLLTAILERVEALEKAQTR